MEFHIKMQWTQNGQNILKRGQELDNPYLPIYKPAKKLQDNVVLALGLDI